MLLRFILPLFLCLAAVLAADSTCSPTKRCLEGCCNEFGSCGYGPDYCGKDTCISDCGRKSECDPGFGADWAQKAKCPLNVCCSEHGFCGTTKDFCGDKTVDHKKCSPSSGNSIVVGYYEGWAQDRPCNIFWPEDIPVGLYTHINFAFATIDPETFRVVPNTKEDVELYERLTLIKERDPDLRIYIAIGGWTFNDPGPTQTVFSDLAASLPRQRAFIESLISFMSTYGFDGVDLDWEYPVAKDRAGREVDFDNFPKFMERLKSSLDGLNKGITITLPASYWYLQHFDIKKLVKHVSWFNIMSYDMHGTWDENIEWTGPFLNAHTNLTEIDQALDLLWRNDIDPDKVVMGMGFYGRTFSVTSSSCTKPGCTFESGGVRGACSREVGILMNSEIDDLVEEHNVKPVLYEKEAVKVATWGDQWVAYDDEETFRLKSRYAQSMCLRGVMVWAISHDTKDAKYNKALARVVNRKILALPALDPEDAYTDVEVPIEQCRWTNCGDSCPKGWVYMRREDGGARDGEFMFDDTGCGGLGVHSFCCPPGDLPVCGWYNHRNGNCKAECPSGTVEVGSHSGHCKKNYQAACCTASSENMQIYSSCEWGVAPLCDQQTGCPNSPYTELVAASSSGSGGAICNMRSASFTGPASDWVVQQRKLCCDVDNPRKSVSDCEWYDNIGEKRPSGSTQDWCKSGCPNDRIRVALDTQATECFEKGAGGGRANCCIPRWGYVYQEENSMIEEWRSALEDFVKNEDTCRSPRDLDRRSLNDSSLQDIDELFFGSTLQRRADSSVDITWDLLMYMMVPAAGVASSMMEAAMQEWNSWMAEEYGEGLHMPGFRDWLLDQPSWDIQGPLRSVDQVICNPRYWARFRQGGSGQDQLDCDVDTCSIESCDESDENTRRGLELDLHSPHTKRSTLEKRSNSYDYRVNLGQGNSMIITRPAYDSVSQLAEDDTRQDEVVNLLNRGDCTNSHLRRSAVPDLEFYQVEHIVEGQMIRDFMQDAAQGVLRSGATARTATVQASFFRQAATMPLINPPPLPGGATGGGLWTRVMECLGSRTNVNNFAILERELNRMKGDLAGGKDPVSARNFQDLAASFAHPHEALHAMRAANAILRYHNLDRRPNVNTRLVNIVTDINDQLRYGETEWNSNNPNRQVSVSTYWREWIRDYYNVYLVRQVRDYISRCAREMRRQWATRTDAYSQTVLDVVTAIEDESGTIDIDISGFP